MQHSTAANDAPITPLTKGWLFTLSHMLLTYVLAQAHLKFLPHHDPTFIEDYAGILKWMVAKGGDGSTLRTHTLYAIATSPLSIVAWYWFGVDAKPRRPTPKIWHASIPILFLIPLIAFFQTKPRNLDIAPGYRSPILRLIASTDAGTSVVITMSIWLLAALLFFALLPLVEIAQSDRTTKEIK